VKRATAIREVQSNKSRVLFVCPRRWYSFKINDKGQTAWFGSLFCDSYKTIPQPYLNILYCRTRSQILVVS